MKKRLVGLTLVVAVVPTSLGCGWFSANESTALSSLGQSASCVISEIAKNIDDPETIVAACAPATLGDIVAIVESLIGFYSQPQPDGGAPSAGGVAPFAHLRAV